MPDPAASQERWYEFEQHELMTRPFYVRAPTLAAARKLVREHKGGSGIGVPDYAPSQPDSILIKGRGRFADQETAQNMADERAGEGGW